MVKINFEVSEMTFAEALNAALDVASHCRKVPVCFVFQGVRIELVCFHENVCAPMIVEPRMISDFDDEVLLREYIHRIKTSQDFRVIADPVLEKEAEELLKIIMDQLNAA